VAASQLEEKKVEPNSGLGGAVTYLLKYWNRLTLFLRQPRAPLDNNVRERALKRAILHRKNSLFYKTEKGAEVGDLFMSLIHTAELCGANPFDYLTQLQRHSGEMKENPSQWMAWNYRDTLQQTDTHINSG
jgi:transposase